jgi:hypothetical protein
MLIAWRHFGDLAELMGNTPQVAFAHYGREWGRIVG